MKHKATPAGRQGFAPILILILIIALVAVGYFSYKTFITQKVQNNDILVPPIDPTADWISYTNTKYNYSFKYPSNWNLRVYAGSNEERESATAFLLEGPYENIDNKVGGWDYNLDVRFNPEKITSESDANKKIEVKPLSTGYLQFTLTSARPEKVISDTQTFDQILSTFKFSPIQLSTEGQSCGILAGSAGNAMCAAGLTCEFKNKDNPYEIGVCVK